MALARVSDIIGALTVFRRADYYLDVHGRAGALGGGARTDGPDLCEPGGAPAAADAPADAAVDSGTDHHLMALSWPRNEDDPYYESTPRHVDA